MSKIIDFNNAVQSTKDNKKTSFTIVKKVFRKSRPCYHNKVVLVEKNRTLYCENCKEPLDAFEVLLEWACEDREFNRDVLRNEAALSETKKIMSEWSFTITEKRRIERARSEIR